VNPTYSQAIKANGMIFVAGQIGIDPATGKLISSDIAEQARQAIENTATICRRRVRPLPIWSQLRCTLAYMIQNGLPLTGEQWMSLNWPDGPPKPWCVEHEMEVPEFWQDPDKVER
jgi:hypothetical protein